MDSRIILFTSIWCSYLEMRDTNIDQNFCEDIRKHYNKWLKEIDNDLLGFEKTEFSIQNYIDKLYAVVE